MPTLYRHTTQWDYWFAWRPVKLNDGRWVWLQDVKRRRSFVWSDYKKFFMAMPYEYISAYAALKARKEKE